MALGIPLGPGRERRLGQLPRETLIASPLLVTDCLKSLGFPSQGRSLRMWSDLIHVMTQAVSIIVERLQFCLVVCRPSPIVHSIQ